MSTTQEAASAGEQELRILICTIGQRLWERRLIAANDGNISVKMPGNRILCTPSGVSKGFLKPEDLLVTNADGLKIQGNLNPSSELKMHVEIYKRRSDTGAVVHAHPPHATAFAAAGLSVPRGVLPEIDVLLGRVPLVAYETPGSQQLATAVGLAASGVGGQTSNAVLLANHGATTCGATLEEAWLRMESLDQSCQTLLLSKMLGGWKDIPPEKQSELVQLSQGSPS